MPNEYSQQKKNATYCSFLLYRDHLEVCAQHSSVNSEKGIGSTGALCVNVLFFVNESLLYFS